MPGVEVPTLEDFNELVARVEALEKGPTGPTGPSGPSGPSGPTGTPTGPTGPVRAFWRSGGSRNTNLGSAVTEWGNFRGRACDFSIVYATRDAGWNAFVSSHYSAGQISTHTDKKLELLIQTAPFPSGGNYKDLVDNKYDSWWQQIGAGLKAREDAGFVPVIVSIAWEMNGTYMYWGGGSGSGPSHYANPDQYIKGYKAIVTSLRKTYPNVKTAWIINAHGTPAAVGTTDPWNLYPGNDVVTFVGIDAYDMYPPSRGKDINASRALYNSQANAVGGIKWLAGKAQSAGKQLIVGEWGVASGAGANGGFDNPDFIQCTFETYQDLFAKGILYAEFYFADPMGGGNVDSDLLSGNPNSAAKYKELYRVA
jgi:Beta-mannanase